MQMFALSNNIKQTYTYDYKEYQSYRSDDGIGNSVGTDTIIWRPDRDTDTAFDNFQLWFYTSNWKLSILKIIIYYDIIE